jgi:hypothetical protein
LFQQTHLESADCWGNVIDFRWHKSGISSPHWRRLTPMEQKSCTLPAALVEKGWTVQHDVGVKLRKEKERIIEIKCGDDDNHEKLTPTSILNQFGAEERE